MPGSVQSALGGWLIHPVLPATDSHFQDTVLPQLDALTQAGTLIPRVHGAACLRHWGAGEGPCSLFVLAVRMVKLILSFNTVTPEEGGSWA